MRDIDSDCLPQEIGLVVQLIFFFLRSPFEPSNNSPTSIFIDMSQYFPETHLEFPEHLVIQKFAAFSKDLTIVK